ASASPCPLSRAVGTRYSVPHRGSVRRARARNHSRAGESRAREREAARAESRTTTSDRQHDERPRDGRKRSIRTSHRKGDRSLRLHGAQDSQTLRETPSAEASSDPPGIPRLPPTRRTARLIRSHHHPHLTSFLPFVANLIRRQQP